MTTTTGTGKCCARSSWRTSSDGIPIACLSSTSRRKNIRRLRQKYFSAAAAMRTKRIRLRHGVVLLIKNINHPLKVAERIAMLDIMSNGRVDFGTGRGNKLGTFRAFEVPVDETRHQWEEQLDRSQKCGCKTHSLGRARITRFPQRRLTRSRFRAAPSHLDGGHQSRSLRAGRAERHWCILFRFCSSGSHSKACGALQANRERRQTGRRIRQ